MTDRFKTRIATVAAIVSIGAAGLAFAASNPWAPAPIERRIAVLETQRSDDSQRLDRIEKTIDGINGKLDRLIERLK